MMKGPGGSFGFGPRSALAILILFVPRQYACQCFTLLNSLWSFRSTAGILFVRKGAGQQLQLTNQPHPISNDCTGRNTTQNCIDESDTNVFKGQRVSNNIMTEESTDFVGAGTLGDIMSDPSDVTNCKEVMQNGGVCVETRYFRDSLLGWNVTANRTEMRKVTSSGLVTSTGGTLTAQFGQKIPNLSPLDRIALTANGNLQRIFSSFYDAPVHVHIDKCVKRGFELDYSCDHDEYYNLDNQDGGGDAVWDRVVHLSVFDQVSKKEFQALILTYCCSFNMDLCF